MRILPKAELLELMKTSLRDLDNLRLLSPTDLYILRVRRNLRHKIDELEQQLLEQQLEVRQDDTSDHHRLAA